VKGFEYKPRIGGVVGAISFEAGGRINGGR
jgi:hypothetical protein